MEFLAAVIQQLSRDITNCHNLIEVGNEAESGKLQANSQLSITVEANGMQT